MPEVKSVKPARVAHGKRRLGYLVILIACVVVLWQFHPWLLEKAIRFSAQKAAETAGLNLQIGGIQADLTRPITVTDVQIEGKSTSTSLQLRSAQLKINALWEIFFRSGRIFRDLELEGLVGVMDYRTAAGSQAGHPGVAAPAAPPSPAKESPFVLPLRLLPTAAGGKELDLQVLADNQVYDLSGASFSISEAELGKFQAAAISVRAGAVQQTWAPVKAITAWKDGAVYLASLTLRPDIIINNLSANFVNPGSVSLRVDAQIFGGIVNGDCWLGRTGSETSVDAAAWASNVDMSPLSTVPGVQGKITGLLREGRFTFRGNPDKASAGEASLRIVADDFHWNDRGWSSLEIGASMIHSRLSVTQFDLKQKDNILSVNGEVSTDKGWKAISHSPLQLNITGSINQIGELAGLLGPPFDEMTGRMSLNGTLSGQAANLNGYLDMEASKMRFRSLPIDSARLESVVKDNEARIAWLEAWSGKDSITGDGSVGLVRPHHYSGELYLSVQNIAPYLAPFRAPNAESIYSGALGVKWQGDGSFAANSGAFDIRLHDFVSALTPSGMTGNFVGTYAPENFYVSTFELTHGLLRFFTHISAASSGLTLKDAELDSGKNPLASGELFLPIDPYALLKGENWRKAIRYDKAVYAQIASPKDVSVRDILRLAGRQEPVGGTVRLTLDASGLPANMKLAGSFAGHGLSARQDGTAGPPSDIDVSLAAGDGKATFSGTLTTEGSSPSKFDAKLPFGLHRTADGTYQWWNPVDGFTASANLPGLDVSVVRSFAPWLASASGKLSGQITAYHTPSQPHLDGTLSLQDGNLRASGSFPGASNLDVLVRFAGQNATLDHAMGQIAEGAIQLGGSVNFQDIGNPAWNLTFSGSKVLIAHNSGLNFPANIDIKADGNNDAGQVTGSVRFADAKLTKRLEVTPLAAVPSGTSAPILTPPDMSFLPKPFSAWKLDVSVTSETPFTFGDGTITPNLKLIGSAGKPVPAGQIDLTNVRAHLAHGALLISAGTITFLEKDPWEPVLDIRMGATAGVLSIQAYAHGRLDERKLTIGSNLPLTEDELLFLIDTGIAPGIGSAANYAEMATGLGSGALLSLIPHPFDLMGGDKQTPAENTLPGDAGFTNFNASYSFRFQ